MSVTVSMADPLDGDPRVAEYFGARFPAVLAFAVLLRQHGEERGLLGPREGARLWERHLLNSAAVAPFLPPGSVVDVGSGAGLPGLVLAAMQPARSFTLIEPMERRAEWLEEARVALDLTNVSVVRARAEQVAGSVSARAVTARAVANVDRLVAWCAPLLERGGEMLFLKGRAAEAEVASAHAALARRGLSAEVLDAPTLAGLEVTRVVRVRPIAEGVERGGADVEARRRARLVGGGETG